MKITVPYGKDYVSFFIPDEMFAGMYDSQRVEAAADSYEEIMWALDNPIGSAPLEKMISADKKVNIIIDDSSRPTPINVILPPLLDKLGTLGIRNGNVRIIAGLGSHRYMTEQELEERVGTKVYHEYEVINSEFKKPERLVQVGSTPENIRIMVTKEVMDADVRIGIGNIVPHPAMGWGGGGKCLFPGVTGEETVAYFHLKGSLEKENQFGKDTTPIREMMEGWVENIGLDFIINTVLTHDFKIHKIVAGHYIKAHREGIRLAKQIVGFKVIEKVDVIVVSSHPADQDLWQSPKGIYSADHALKGTTGGTIVLISPNDEGVGPHADYVDRIGRDDGDDLIKEALAGKPCDDDLVSLAIGNNLAKIRQRRKIVVVGDGVTTEEMRRCGFAHYNIKDLQRAVDEAAEEYPGCRIAAVSQGSETFLY